MRDFAFAICVDDEVDHVRLIVDILRRNWTGDFYVAVCASNVSCAAEIEKCDIDDVAVAEGVRFEPPPTDEAQKQFSQAVRDVDGIRKACALAAGSGAPYTIHLRAGCFALAWDSLRALGEEMRCRGKVFAARGQGFGFYAHDTPVGRFDESFFVFDNAFARAKRLWEFELADFLPHKVTAPGFVALWGLGRVGVRRFWRYSDGAGSEVPVLFDPARRFLRIDERRLPGDLGARLKASYFTEHGVTRGQAMERFLAQWGKDLASVQEELRELHRLRDKQDDVSRSGRAGWLLRWVYRYRYGDMVWPGRLDDMYRAVLEGAKEVPAELRCVSFDMP